MLLAKKIKKNPAVTIESSLQVCMERRRGEGKGERVLQSGKCGKARAAIGLCWISIKKILYFICEKHNKQIA